MYSQTDVITLEQDFGEFDIFVTCENRRSESGYISEVSQP
jgi:hypothetical protein